MNTIKPWQKALVVVLILFGILIRFFFISKGPEFLINWWILIDDSFYSFKIANNVAEGKGLSVDGIHPTNGIQPLYLGILVPIFFLFRKSLFTPVTLAISITSIFNIFTGYFIYRIVREKANYAAAIFSLFLWCFSMTVVNLGMNGLETSIATFFCILSSFYYLKYIKRNSERKLENIIIFGLFLGLTCLARLDGTIFLLALLIDFLVSKREKKKEEIYSYVIAGIFVFPWLLSSLLRMGTIVPISGQAARLIALINGIRPYFSVLTSRPEFFPIDSPPAKFYIIHILGSFHIFKMYSFFLYPFNFLETFLLKISLLINFSYFKLQVGVAAMVIATVIIILFKKGNEVFKKIEEFFKNIKDLNFLIYFVILLFINYSFYVFGMWHYPRYYFPVCAIAAVYSGLFFDLIFRKILKEGISLNKAVVNVFVIFVYLSYSLFFIYGKNMDNFYGLKTYLKPKDFNLFYYETAHWINKNIPKGEKIGVIESGMIGYFCKDHRVINLDGVQNKDAFEACRDKRMLSYIKNDGIKYVVGQEVLIINQLWKRSTFEDRKSARLQYIATVGDARGLQMKIYKVF